MPNWCENDLYIREEKKGELDRFLSGIGTDENGESNGILKTYYPLPPELSATSSPRTIVKDEAELQQKLAEHPGISLAGFVTEAESARLIEKYGANDWYNWCNDKWGTKWGDCRMKVLSHRNGKAKLTFDTAWSPPIDGLLEVSKKFPELVFDLRFFEGGMQFQGTAVIKNGEIIEETSGSYAGGRGG